MPHDCQVGLAVPAPQVVFSDTTSLDAAHYWLVGIKDIEASCYSLMQVKAWASHLALASVGWGQATVFFCDALLEGVEQSLSKLSFLTCQAALVLVF